MEKEHLTHSLHAYAVWRAEVSKHIRAYQKWLAGNDAGNMELDLRIDDTCEALRADRVVIAFVAEFSRGKTELINSIFFADYKRRLLPSTAGRTTMCPTELFFDHDAREAYIRLLPIETRLEDISISEYKRNPEAWTTLPLEVGSPDHMVETFKEVIKVKKVPVARAKALGLYSEGEMGASVDVADSVEIPMWRHAMISFPHPLLKEGLVILDTPGLNALGSEPELTIDMLPSAHAVVFVLGADTGGTKSDMEMWQHHVRQFSEGDHKGLLVALNKIDTLWDELETEPAIAEKIAMQCSKTAKTLGIAPESVYPVSAQKALLGKVKQDQGLLERSGILGIEAALSDEILPYKQNIVRDRVINDIGSLVQASRDAIAARLGATRKQIEQLRALRGKNEQVVNHLLKTTREESIAYKVRVENFQASRGVFVKQVNEMLDYLNIGVLDKQITKAREMMSGTWTTHGMRSEMKNFFDALNHLMNQVSFAAEKANEAVEATYRRFSEDYGMAEVKPVLFAAETHQRRMERLCQQADEFRNSPITTMTEQSFVVKKFFISMVSHARDVLDKAHQEAEVWSKSAMAPLAVEIKEHKQDLEDRMENLRRIGESRETLEGKLKELEAQQTQLAAQLKTLTAIHDGIHAPIEPVDTRPAQPAVA